MDFGPFSCVLSLEKKRSAEQLEARDRRLDTRYRARGVLAESSAVEQGQTFEDK